MTEKSHDPHLILRAKEDRDGVEPCLDSVMVLNLLFLYQFTSREDFRKIAEQTLKVHYSNQIQNLPSSMVYLLVGLNSFLNSPKQIFIVGKRNAADVKVLLNEIYSCYIPNRVIIFLESESSDRQKIEQRLPFTKNMEMIENKATVYICIHSACQQPTNDLAVLRELLKK